MKYILENDLVFAKIYLEDEVINKSSKGKIMKVQVKSNIESTQNDTYLYSLLNNIYPDMRKLISLTPNKSISVEDFYKFVVTSEDSVAEIFIALLEDAMLEELSAKETFEMAVEEVYSMARIA